MPYTDDHNGAEQDGVGYCHLLVKDGVRQSQTVAFLRPVLDAPNLAVHTGTRARRLLLEDGRCVGVETDGGELRAGQEVVVCGGHDRVAEAALLSGSGPADELARVGIDGAVDLPGVGENLHDHLLAPVICSSARPMPRACRGRPQLHAHLFARSRGGLPAPDTQPLVFHVPAYRPGWRGRRTGSR